MKKTILKNIKQFKSKNYHLIIWICVCFLSCDRPVCKNTNPIFDEYQPESKEYKLELIKQLETVDKSNLRYWLKKYTESENEVQLHFYVQSKELCAVLVLNVEQWNKLEQLQKTKGKGYFNAEFTNLQFETENNSLNPKFIYKDFAKILD